MNAVALPVAVAEALRGVAAGASSRATRALSDRYRAGTSSADGHVVRSAAELAAYAVTRFPATYAAAVAAFTECAAADPGFAPVTLLDVGSGLGATACAALAVWDSIAAVTCVEADSRAADAGRAVLDALGVPTRWVVTDATAGRPATPGGTDLVTAGYVGNELADPTGFAASLWDDTGGLLVLLEPGRHSASHGLLAARAALLDLGAVTLAPCPHDRPCPLPAADWCHFGQRLPRTAAHRQAKGADLSWEDEKFAYVAMTRGGVDGRPGARVIRRPTRRKGLVELPVCATDGLRTARVGKADPRYRDAKDAGWGSAWPAPGR